MMYAELHEYLLIHQVLPLPGLGHFQVKRHPAVMNFPERQIEGPGYSIQWEDGKMLAPERLLSWIAGNSNISDHDARHRLEKFIFQLKNHIVNGDIIHWKGIGSIQKGTDVVLKFSGGEIIREGVVPAHKVIREKAEHMVKVGEEERTSEQMTVLLSTKSKTVFSGWRIAAAVAGLLSIGFIIWYLSQHGWDPNAGNRQALELNQVNGPTYTLQP